MRTKPTWRKFYICLKSFITIKMFIFLFSTLSFGFGVEKEFYQNTIKVQLTVNGKVIDQSGIPLSGANVLEKGTTNGVTADFDGNFSINISDNNSTLVFSYIGFATKEVAVNGETSLSIILNESASGLDEVVVIAYSKSLKSTLTSSISTLKGEAMVDAPVANIENTLSGRIPGVLTYQTSGEPGNDATTIKIRGQNTTGNSAPLVIIDGIPGNLADIIPENVESMSVLKDAAAVAPYGLAAANGVILVTTKKGIKQSPKFSFNSNYGIQNPVKLTKTINSYQTALIQNETYRNDHPNDLNAPVSDQDLEEYRKVVEGDPSAKYSEYFNSNNMRDIIRKDYIISNQNFSVRGGSDDIVYYAGLGHLNQESMIPNQDFQKFNGVLNLDADLSDTFKVSFGVKMWKGIKTDPSFGGRTTAEFGLYQGVYLTSPMEAIWYPNSGGKWANGAFGYNPIGRIKTSGVRKLVSDYSQYSLGVEKILPIEGLSIKGVFNYRKDGDYVTDWSLDPIYYTVDNTVSPALYTQGGGAAKPQYTESYGTTESMYAQAFLNYDRAFGEHRINGLAVYELRDIKDRSLWAGRKNYSIPIHTVDMGSSAQADLSNGGTASDYRSVGVVAKIGYSYQNKYLVDFSGRYDAHYYFAPGHRGGTFPAVSLGWRIGQENFIKENYSWINELKIRGSWGESGNLAGGPFQYSSTYGTYGEAYRLGGNLGQGLFEQSIANPNITWEKQNQTDVGVDLILWNNLLSLTFDYFYQKRNNMLLVPDTSIPAEYGIGLSEVNAGKMSNQGFDFSIGTAHVFDNEFSLNAQANVSFARNKQLEIFENPVTYDDPNRRRTGTALGSMWGLKSLGFFQSEEEIANSPIQKFGSYTVGDVKYADMNNDGIVDGTDEILIGRPNFPEMQFGLSVSVRWKDFDASVLFQGATLADVYAPGPNGGAVPGGINVTQIEALDHWTPETPNARFPRYSILNQTNNFRTSSLRVVDGTYIRMKNLSIGYTLFPDLFKKQLNIDLLRLYVSAENMLTWTAKDLNSDPESAAGGRYRFANQKVMSLGINITF